MRKDFPPITILTYRLHANARWINRLPSRRGFRAVKSDSFRYAVHPSTRAQHTVPHARDVRGTGELSADDLRLSISV